MGLKRKLDEDTEDIPLLDDSKRRQVEELMNMAPPSTSGTGGASSSTKKTAREILLEGRRQMQGQSAEGGIHSIDSDEEEDYVKSKKVAELDDDDIEGMEDESKIEREGEVQITPFNMKDEKEEGFVAADGSFVYNKKKEELKDSWLDNIDWGKVKERSEEEINKQDEDDEKEMEAEANYKEMDNFREILSLMKPKETVAKTLIRIGGGKKTTAQKLKEKKRQKEGKETDEEKQRREDMAKLTGLADAILSRSGHMEIYEETYESIAYKIKKEDEKPTKAVIPDGMDGDDALDYFMANTTTENREENGKKPESKKDEGGGDKKVEEDAIPLSNEVTWEYKWENNEKEEVHGPFSSADMLKWQESGFFDKGVFVRKNGSAEFCDGKRIDFDLYV